MDTWTPDALQLLQSYSPIGPTSLLPYGLHCGHTTPILGPKHPWMYLHLYVLHPHTWESSAEQRCTTPAVAQEVLWAYFCEHICVSVWQNNAVVRFHHMLWVVKKLDHGVARTTNPRFEHLQIAKAIKWFPPGYLRLNMRMNKENWNCVLITDGPSPTSTTLDWLHTKLSNVCQVQ